MQLSLDHVMSLMEILTPLHVGIVIGLFVLALITLSFTRRWWGLITGLVILCLGIGVVGVLGMQVKESTNTHQLTTVLNQNAIKLRAAAKTAYGLNLTASQAEDLASGTESFIPTGKNAQQFGTVTGVTVPVSGGTVVTPITLFYDKGTWVIAYTNSSGGYTKVQVLK